MHATISHADKVEADQQLSTQLIAVVDGDMPAYGKVAQDRAYNAPPEAARGTINLITDFHPLEAIRTYNQLREPDMYDEGFAHWFGPYGVVSVPIEKMVGFNAYVRANGLIRPEACFTLHPFEDIPRGFSWEMVRATCTV